MPMTSSIVPSARPARVSAASLAETKRESWRTRSGQAAEAFGEVLEVLAGEERGGGDDGDLHAGHGGDEGGAQRDLGLAEADVAADEAVHGLAGFEVLEDVGDGGELVVGLGIGEAGAELLPGVVVGRREDGALPERALGGDADEALGHVADAALEAGLLRLPGAAAEPVEQALLVAVAGEELDVLDRQVELVAAGVFESEALVRGAHGGDGLEALVAADAVVDVDDEIARGEAGGLGEEVLGALAAARGADQPVAEDVLLGDDGEARRLEAVLERPDGEAEGRRRPPRSAARWRSRGRR